MYNKSTIPTVFFTISMGALASSLVKITEIETNVILYAVFMGLLRLKFFLDDLHYFRNEDNLKSLLFFIGYFMALLSWFSWIISILFLPINLKVSIIWLIIVFALSTVWIIVDIITTKRFKKLIRWVWFNSLYILLSYLLYSFLDYGIFSILLIVLLSIDFYISESYLELNPD